MKHSVQQEITLENSQWCCKHTRTCTCTCTRTRTCTHAHTHTQFYGSLDFVRDNLGEPVQEEHSPTQTYRGHQSSLICFLHQLWSTASSLFNLSALQSFSTISVQIFFGLPLGQAPSTSYSIHFFIQSLSSFCSTCPYHRNLFCCSTKIMSTNHSLSLNPLERV